MLTHQQIAAAITALRFGSEREKIRSFEALSTNLDSLSDNDISDVISATSGAEFDTQNLRWRANGFIVNAWDRLSQDTQTAFLTKALNSLKSTTESHSTYYSGAIISLWSTDKLSEEQKSRTISDATEGLNTQNARACTEILTHDTTANALSGENIETLIETAIGNLDNAVTQSKNACAALLGKDVIFSRLSYSQLEDIAGLQLADGPARGEVNLIINKARTALNNAEEPKTWLDNPYAQAGQQHGTGQGFGQ